jgi:hypothetical protein
MLTNRLLLLTAACALPLATVACGGSDDGDTITPEGTHHGYVVSKATAVPALGHMPIELGIDVGSKTGATLDGKPENQLGDALQFLATINAGLNIQTSIDGAIAQGTILLLLDFQSKDFVNSNAGLGVKFGATPMPPACSGQADTVCGNHLKGGASFTVAASSPHDALLGGKLANGAFNGGPGELSLEIAFGSTEPILLPLHHARAKVTSVSATALSGTIGGVITVGELHDSVGAGIQKSVTGFLAAGCTALDSPPGCGCTDLAATVMMLIDGQTAAEPTPDCKLSIDELVNNPVISDYLKPDACSMDTCSAPDALSVGIQINAVAATFPM